MANPAPTINQINAFNATQGTTIDFNIIGGTELIRSNRIYIYDLSDNSLICTHLYVSTESIHELPPNTDGSIVYESGKSSADFVNGAQYYAQIQTYTDTNGTQGGSGLSVAKMFWCLGDPTLTITTIPSTISTTSYNISATYTDTSASVVSNIMQQYQFNLYSATGSLLQSSGVVVGSGTQQGTSDVYDISYNFTGLNVGSSYYVTVNVTTTQGMSVNAQSNTFTVSIDTPTLGEATVINNACDGYISVTSNLSGEYGGSGSGEIVSFETDSEDIFTKLQVDLEPIQEGSGAPSPSNVRPIRGHSGVDVKERGFNRLDEETVFASFPQLEKQADGSWYTNQLSQLIDKTVWENDNEIEGSICLSFDYKYESASYTGLRFKVYYTDGTNASFYTSISQVFARKTGTTQSNKTVSRIAFDYGSAGVGSYIKNVCINVSDPERNGDYEPYQGLEVEQNFNVSLTPTSTDTTPYLFKAVGDVYGDRLEDKIVGGTVAWNQLISSDSIRETRTVYGVTFTNNGDGSITLSGTATESSLNIGTVKGFAQNTKHIYFRRYFSKGAMIQEVGHGIDNDQITFGIEEGVTYDVTYYPQLFDLTQMFGSTIADYIYSLEQSQAGAGVAWFKKLFPNDYYAYNAGELLSVEGLQSHDMVGFNQCNETPTVGWFFDEKTGAITKGHSAVFGAIENKIRCVPSTQYYISIPNFTPTQNRVFLLEYDASGGFIGYQYLDIKTNKNALFRTKSNTYTVLVAFFTASEGASYTASDFEDFCINLSNPTRNGEYEPYEKHSYPLDSSLTLRGIPKLDASNNLYYDGDEYTSDGKVKRKYGVVDLGSLNWEYAGSASATCYSVDTMWFLKQNILCVPYVKSSELEKGIYAVDGVLRVIDSSYTDAATFKAAMSGVMLVYELATPTTETAAPYTNPQIVSKYGTLEYVTNSIVPVGHKTTYLTRDIFGGYVDLISGKLVVDKAMVVFDGTQSDFGISVLSTFTQLSWSGYISIGSTPAKFISDTFEFDGTGGLGKIYASKDAPRMYFGMPTSITSPSEAQEWFRQHPTSVVYPLATPQTYQLTPQQVNTLVGTNNVWSEQGNIELSYHIPITNLLVKRQDVDDVSGGWLTLYSQPITQASDMDFTFIDFLNQYGKTYKYALVPLLTQTQSGVEVEVEGGYTVSNEVQSVFDGVFIADSTGSQKCKANVGYGNVDMNQVVGSITPIGAKYPIIITNSHNQYHNGSISGTIVPDDYYFNGNLSRIDMVNKRNELEQFLTNKRVKVIKDWNGNIWLVMIAGNVSCTFNNNYGMGIVDFSTNWIEVGDPTNQQDLQATGLINVGGV